MSEIRFSSKEHEKFFYQMLAKCGKHDSYYSSFFYCVGISEDTRNHVDRMFDFKERLIKPEALHEGADRRFGTIDQTGFQLVEWICGEGRRKLVYSIRDVRLWLCTIFL